MSPGEFIPMFEKNGFICRLDEAEGVETEEQKERLRSMNCDIAQGYFYAKPIPADEYENLHQLSSSMLKAG